MNIFYTLQSLESKKNITNISWLFNKPWRIHLYDLFTVSKPLFLDIFVDRLQINLSALVHSFSKGLEGVLSHQTHTTKFPVELNSGAFCVTKKATVSFERKMRKKPEHFERSQSFIRLSTQSPSETANPAPATDICSVSAATQGWWDYFLIKLKKSVGRTASTARVYWREDNARLLSASISFFIPIDVHLNGRRAVLSMCAVVQWCTERPHASAAEYMDGHGKKLLL